MQILKYLFLLLSLSFFTLCVFVATQRGDFTIQRSKIIKAPKTAVFNYINDYKNWKHFNSWILEDPEIKLTYPNNTVGLGSSFSWSGQEGDGEINTTFVKVNDSLAQKMSFDRTTSDVYWSFKETNIGTKINIKAKGKMGFILKIKTFFTGGIDYTIGENCDKSIANLEKSLDVETNFFKINIDGQVKKLESIYLKQFFTSKIEDIEKNKAIVFNKINRFCEQNKIARNGQPFLLFHAIDRVNKTAKLSFCMPIMTAYLPKPGSVFLFEKLPAFSAVKTTFMGDYSHIQKAKDQTINYFTKNKIKQDTKFDHIEIYTIGKNEEQNASKWITHIYYPIYVKPIIVAPRIVTPMTEEVITTPEVEETEPTEF